MSCQPVQVINNIVLAGAASDWQPEMLEALIEAVNASTINAIESVNSKDKDIGECMLIEHLEPEDAGEAWAPVKKLLERILLNTEQKEVCKWITASREGGGIFEKDTDSVFRLYRQIINNKDKGLVAKLAVVDGFIGLSEWDMDKAYLIGRDILESTGNHVDAKKWISSDLKKAQLQGAIFSLLSDHFGPGVLPMVMTDLDVSLPVLQAALTKMGKGHERFFKVLEEKIVTPLRAGKKPDFGTMVIEKATAAGEECSTWTAFRFV